MIPITCSAWRWTCKASWSAGELGRCADVCTGRTHLKLSSVSLEYPASSRLFLLNALTDKKESRKKTVRFFYFAASTDVPFPTKHLFRAPKRRSFPTRRPIRTKHTPKSKCVRPGYLHRRLSLRTKYFLPRNFESFGTIVYDCNFTTTLPGGHICKTLIK